MKKRNCIMKTTIINDNTGIKVVHQKFLFLIIRLNISERLVSFSLFTEMK